ncbi:hypothetical protein EDL98_11180 [Ornithobacterium rhinotracheale]|uniref:hypothetical protein n=1 Tax=Ornithobacterium rhinotracheale TaxID=28251 RepID=UPI00129C85E0|nr:hypothetical protein [Ornithobacterium rhinotracheale]MRJ11627.1 hypothetical protein [Ornithobacterium rhinotracheale]
MKNFSLKLLLLLGLTFGLSSCLSNDDDKDINLSNKQLAGTMWSGKSFFEINGNKEIEYASFNFLDEKSIDYTYVRKGSTAMSHPEASYVAQKNTIIVDNVSYRKMFLVKKFTRDSLVIEDGDGFIRLKRKR